MGIHRRNTSTVASIETEAKVSNFILSPLTAGAVHIRFLHFFSAHCISAFKPGQDKK